MARCFVAVELPEELRVRVDAALGSLRGETRAVRWVPEQNLHLTLKFLGEVEEGRISAVTEALQSVSPTASPFRWELSSAGFFPPGKRPRVFWLGAGEGAEPLRKLAGAVGAALRSLGFQPEDRPFQPHLTVGRVRDGGRIEESFFRRWEGLGGERFGAVLVNDLVLMQSELRPEGPLYTPIARVALGEKTG